MAEHLNEDCLIGPIILNQDETFVDGAFAFNNPSEIAINLANVLRNT